MRPGRLWQNIKGAQKETVASRKWQATAPVSERSYEGLKSDSRRCAADLCELPGWIPVQHGCEEGFKGIFNGSTQDDSCVLVSRPCVTTYRTWSRNLRDPCPTRLQTGLHGAFERVTTGRLEWTRVDVLNQDQSPASDYQC